MNRHLVDEDAVRRSVVLGLRGGMELSDLSFDRIYPAWARQLSELHWTPVDVARRAAKLLGFPASNRVLDIGSGVGKFCLIGAITTRATFVGIELRKNLVEVARHTAERCGATRAQFYHGNMVNLDWSEFDGFYLFNPFYEHLVGHERPIGRVVERSPELFRRYVDATCAKLSAARTGTRVVTYNGFGGLMPDGYRLLLREPAGTDHIEVWEQGAHTGTAGRSKVE
jgi:SAM-dependent methyltransferase